MCSPTDPTNEQAAWRVRMVEERRRRSQRSHIVGTKPCGRQARQASNTARQARYRHAALGNNTAHAMEALSMPCSLSWQARSCVLASMVLPSPAVLATRVLPSAVPAKHWAGGKARHWQAAKTRRTGAPSHTTRGNQKRSRHTIQRTHTHTHDTLAAPPTYLGRPQLCEDVAERRAHDRLDVLPLQAPVHHVVGAGHTEPGRARGGGARARA